VAAIVRRGGATERDPRSRRVRSRVLIGMSAMFVVTMAVAGTFSMPDLNDAAGQQVFLLRLSVLAVGLPLLMTFLARRILEPAEELGDAHGRLLSLYSQARLDALVDPITGLGNHRAFQEELHRQLEDARRHDHPLVLVLVDVDDLKSINDERGHVGGDQLLGTMGRLITSACRATDRGFRIGGDEFAILLPHCDGAAAHAVMRRLLGNALGTETARAGEGFSFSAGLSAYPELAADGHRLFRQADAALYWVKRHGRTDVQLFDAERHGASDDNRSIPELAEAVVQVAQRRALSPVYQPIFDLHTGAPVGFEGLVRPTEDAGFRDAGALFTAADAANRTVELDLVCIETIAASASWVDATHYLSFNISPRSLETTQFSVTALTALMRAHGIAPNQAVLELTERETIEDMDRLRVNLEACRAAGMRIAADDVGAGNAGLRLLSEIDFDVVKVDLSLVHGGVLRTSALAVLRAIQDLAAQSGASVIAEGIETVDQLQVVRDLGILQGQGFLLAMPSADVALEPIDIDALMAFQRDVRLAFLDLSA